MTDKIDEEDRASIYAAMAEIEDDEQEERNARNPFINKSSGKTVTVPLADGKSIEVPSPDYVRGLEQTIRKQAATIEKIERQLHRIDAKLRTHRSALNGATSRINDAHRELDQKIDRRD